MWKIETRKGYKRFYEVFLIPSIRFNNWSATHQRQGEDGEFIPVKHVQEYALTIAFLSAYFSLVLKKETPV